MDEPAFRRANLERILKVRFDDNQSAMARALKRKQSFVNGLLRDKRPFGEKLARLIEKRLQLDKGALDLPPGIDAALRAPLSVGWPFSFDHQRYFRLSIAQREQIERLVLLMVDDFERDQDRPKKPKRAAARQ